MAMFNSYVKLPVGILNMIKPSNFKVDDSAWRSMVFGSADYRHQVTHGKMGDFWGSESTCLILFELSFGTVNHFNYQED